MSRRSRAKLVTKSSDIGSRILNSAQLNASSAVPRFLAGREALESAPAPAAKKKKKRIKLKPFACDVCGEVFSLKAMDRHRRRVHFIPTPQQSAMVKCPHCRKAVRQCNLRKHMEKMHPQS
ncbi:hypothetical protein [Phycisphaera mikurensis]|uniref:hypothetical protein n=1 Tax=Phycisphaera mikurensis TaxID=547188 RepID=UPI0012B5A912